jgi:hypothetical protein
MNIPESFTIQQKQLFLSNNIKENFSGGIENLEKDINKALSAQKKNDNDNDKEDSDDNKESLEVPNVLIEDSEELSSMFERLKDAEKLCDQIEQRQELRDQEEETKILENAEEELNTQQTRIAELKGILKKLQAEKMRSQKINNKCHANKQKIINTDYQMIKELMKTGGDIGKDKSVNLDLNISDSLKNLKGSFKYDFDNNKINYKMTTDSPASMGSKNIKDSPKTLSKKEIEELKKQVAGSYMVPNDVKFVTKKEIEDNYKKCEIDKEKYIDINELQFGICKGCDPNVIKPKISQINKDFK